MHRRSALSLCLVGGFISLAFAAFAQTASVSYKNIQVMKEIPADQLIPSMQFMASSLGVHCDHCHVEHAFEKDDKKAKQQAREMIKMVTALNANSLSGTRGVTCYSCHRGSLVPKRTPVVQGEPAMQPVAAPVPGSSTKADEILAKCLRALGGTAEMRKIVTEVKSGTVEMGPGVQFEMQVQLKDPKRRYEVIHFTNGESTEIADGDSGWRAVAGRPTQALIKSEALAARETAEPQFLSRIKESYKELAVSPDVQIDGKKANVVRASNPDGSLVRLFIDANSGLLVRIVRYVDSPLGRNPTQIDFSDYRDVAGTKQPFHWKISQPQGSFSVQFDRIEVNVPVDDSIFKQPATMHASE